MIRLERPLWSRLLGGARLQPLVATIVVLLAVRAVGQAAGVIDSGRPPIGGTLLVLAGLAVVLAVGAAGWAAADDAGVRWRYYRTHRYAWQEIEGIDLEVRSTGVANARFLIAVRAHGRRHVITPAHAAGRGRKQFGRELLAAAAARGVPVEDGWS